MAGRLLIIFFSDLCSLGALSVSSASADAGTLQSPVTASCSGGICTATVNYSNYTVFTWVAPANVTTISFDVRGAVGGASDSDCTPCTINAGGLGGTITGSLRVTPGTTYYLVPGGAGTSYAGPYQGTPSGGFNGGGGTTVNYPTDFPGTGGGAEAPERVFAEKLDSREDVKFFMKLPDKFKIDTPVGPYNPDWAIIKQDEDGTNRIYMIRETKSTLDESKLRPSEVAKIKAATEHFELLGIGSADVPAYAISAPANWSL